MLKLNKKIQKSLALALCLSTLLVPAEGYAAKNNQSTTQQTKTASVAAGWVKSGSRWWYRNADGSYPKNSWKQVKGKWYYFDASGWMVTGWRQIKGKWYYLNPGNGDMAEGWKKINTTWYYLTPGSGAMATGWIKVNGKYYFMNSSGAMQHDTWVDNGAYYVDNNGVWNEGKTAESGEETKTDSDAKDTSKEETPKAEAKWIKSGSRWWYREANGTYPRNQWKEINGQWYFFDASGWMVTGWMKRASGWYYLTPGSGAMATGWQKISGKWYYLNPGNGDMAQGWKKIEDTWYYLTPGNGAMVTGWKKIGNYWYYLTPGSGKMAVGWNTINGARYYMNPSGAMAEGWSKQDDTWYYLNPGSGKAATGWLKLKNVWYYLNAEGKMLTGWQRIGGKDYYLNPGNGAMAAGGWLKLDDVWYYLSASGARATGWLKLGSTWYYLDPNSGQMATGWTQVGSNRYYMNASGVMQTGWHEIDGDRYYFYSSGAMAVSTTISGITLGEDGKAKETTRGSGVLTDFLKTALEPVGSTLYVWGGGHDAWTGGDALRIGVNPKWQQFYNQQGASYDYTKHRYAYQYGLDCSGLISWAVYNTYNTESNQAAKAYSSTSTAFPTYLTNKGLGTHKMVSGGTFTPGDVVSMTGHVWIVLGMCSDGSLVIVHATPPVVQISGTVNTAGSTNSEAVKLANAYMKKYYSDAASKYTLCIASKSYVNNVDRFQWYSSSMKDPEGLRNMNAAQVLEKLIGPK